MSPRYDLVSRDEHLMLYAHDKSVYSIIIIQCWSLIEAILQLKYPNSSSSSRYYILSMRTRRIESTGRTKTTNAFDEFEDGGDVETTKERGQAYGRRGRWIRVCRKRIEFTARFLRRPIVAGFNSDSFSTRHIKFMACTVRITHPPERVNTRRPLKGCETTTPRLASSFPLFPFSRLFSPGHLREWIFRRFFHSPPPLEPCSIFTTSTFSPAIFAAPRNTPVSTVFQMIEVIENSSDRQQLAVNNLVGERVVQRNGTSNRKREHSLRRLREENFSSEPSASRDYHLYFAKKFGRAMSWQCSFRGEAISLGSRVKVNGSNLDYPRKRCSSWDARVPRTAQKFLNEREN